MITSLAAMAGTGVEALLAAITAKLASGFVDGHVRIPANDGAALAWLHEVGAYRGSDAAEEALDVAVSLSVADAQTLLEEEPHFSSGNQSGLHAGYCGPETECRLQEKHFII